MSGKSDPIYDQAQSQQVRQAAERLQEPGWGSEEGRVRVAYDRDLRRKLPVDGKGRRK